MSLARKRLPAGGKGLLLGLLDAISHKMALSMFTNSFQRSYNCTVAANSTCRERSLHQIRDHIKVGALLL
jgi:hypothetical protein